VTSAARVCQRFALHNLAQGFDRQAITIETAINSAAFQAFNPQLLIPNFPQAKRKHSPLRRLIATVPKLEFGLTNWNDNLLTISNRNKKAIFRFHAASTRSVTLRGRLRITASAKPLQLPPNLHRLVRSVQETPRAMTAKGQFTVGKIRFGAGAPLFLIAGPCVIESEGHAMGMAEKLGEIAGDLGVPYIFKASYDKANRSSVSSFRGPGLKDGLKILAKIKKRTGLPILTDVHEVSHVEPAADVCDILQVPAFLSRQTDLLVAVGKSGRVANLKKGQFLSPWEMGNAAEKVAGTGNQKIILTERGSSFGYQNLVVDMRSFPIMRKLGYPVVFDVTHAVQLPGGEGKSSGGQPEFIEPLARAGTAVGVDGIFLEVHDNPAKALSDGTNALPLNQFRPLLEKIKRLAELARELETSARPR
jgi:2-dehydro-3-deoxyphosphooctonate aldolase (KDO 8-P synthase)